MSTSLIVILLLCLLLVQIPILAACIALAAKLLRLEAKAFTATLRIAALLYGLNLVLVLLSHAIETVPAATKTALPAIGIILVAIGMLVLFGWLIKRTFNSSRWKATGVVFIALPLSWTVAFGFAIAFRTYLAEAFVVPTGSMATTIIGMHSNIVCPNCNCHFAVSRSEMLPPLPPFEREPINKEATCNNCGQKIPVPATTEVLSGDRILVDKVGSPRRWEPVVYKSPEDRSTNYVHRLVGLAGEKLAIANGDIFINDTRLEKLPNEQLDLWFPVHDTQLVPKTTDEQTPHWQPVGDGWTTTGNGWKTTASKAKNAASEQSEKPAELVFDGPITNRLAYNAPDANGMFRVEQEKHVGDVQIVCQLDRIAGAGTWTIAWEFDNRLVQSAFTPAGEIELSCDASVLNQQNEIQRAAGKFTSAANKPKQISLAIRDGVAYVLEDNQIRAKLPVAATKLAEAPPAQDSQSGRASLRAQNCDLAIARIQLARDVFYTQPEIGFRASSASRFTVQLKPEELFVLGDNSALSKDSRYNGPSLKTDILGTARARYWPPSRWHSFE